MHFFSEIRQPSSTSPSVFLLVIVLLIRRENVDNAASHAAQHHGVPPLDETLGFEPAP